MELQDLLGVPHRRFNPLTRDWVLVSPHRTQRPWQGQVETSAPPSLSAYEANCYLCPGNERAKGSEVIGCWSSGEDYKTLGETGPRRMPYPVLIRKNPSAFTDHGVLRVQLVVD
jgi:galactose-1-phosphate uridylyltransferase